VQSVSAAQAVAQAVALAQTRLPGQGAGLSAAHDPAPSHVEAAVKVLASQDAEGPQGVPAAICSQAPPAAQLPSSPQGGEAGHWPAGAGLPASIGAQVPSGCPVSVVVHAWQVPVHAEPQHTPFAQEPLVHWFAAAQGIPAASVGVQAPALQ
jgi:hypothetical protein